MALFKISRGNSVDLVKQPLTEGYAWFTPNDGKFYIDALVDNNLTRVPLSSDRADKDKNGRDITTYTTFYFWLNEDSNGNLSLSTGLKGETATTASAIGKQIIQAYKDNRTITCILKSANKTNNIPCPLPMFICEYDDNNYMFAFSGSGGFTLDAPHFMTVLCQNEQWQIMHNLLVPGSRMVNNKYLSENIITKFIVSVDFSGIEITNANQVFANIQSAYINGDYVVCQTVIGNNTTIELPVVSASANSIQFGDWVYYSPEAPQVWAWISVTNSDAWFFHLGTVLTGEFGDEIGNFNAQNKKITQVATPTEDTDVANKQYVDNAVEEAKSSGGIATRYTVTITTPATEVLFGKTFTDTTHLSVYHNGLLLTPGVNYSVKSNNTGIDLTDYSCATGDIFTFVNAESTSNTVASEIVRGSTVATAGVSTIAIPISITSTIGLAVYENGILLEEGEQYTATTSAITLNGYTAEAGDVYTFVSNKVLTGFNATPNAQLITLNSSKFTGLTNVQSALESLKDITDTLNNSKITNASELSLNSSKFSNITTTQAALENLQDNKLSLSGGTLTGAVTVNNTLTASNFNMSASNSATNLDYIIGTTSSTSNFAKVTKANFLTMFAGTTVSTNSGTRGLRNIMFKTAEPTSSEGSNGDICIVYTA